MSKTLTWTIGLAFVGLVIGYLIFGRIAGDYVPVATLISADANALEDLFQSLVGIEKARTNILISGAVGAGFGLLAGLLSQRRR